MPSTDLITALGVETVVFFPMWRQQITRQRNGVTRVADLGDALWRAQLTTGPNYLDDFAQIEALAESLDGSIGTFYCWNPARQYPQSDPGGVLLGSSSVAIKSVGSDNHSLALKGLPAGYELTLGDMLSFDYSVGATTVRALHRIVESATADGAGETAEFDVRPHVRAGAAANDVVSLKRPAMEAMIEPGSYSPRAAALFGRLAFTALQVVAA